MNLAARGTRTLNVAFAMGGGVSLGTFSGAALGEAIKLLLAYATYKDPITKETRRYADVIVDAFSGASAGALSLGVMLRVLVNPEDYRKGSPLALLGLPTLELAVRAVEDDFACVLRSEPEATRERLRYKLAAAQLVQDVQHYAWGREIGMDILLGLAQGEVPDAPAPGIPADPDWPASSKTAPSLLNSAVVTRLARRVLSKPNAPTADFFSRSLLGERVLYACSLASFVPLRADAGGQLLREGAGALERWAAASGASSKPRRDLRVFDLFPKPVVSDAIDPGTPHEQDPVRRKYPGRWVRYAVQKLDGVAGDLYGADAWSRIGATAIASGAFPFALAPVTLRRFQFEMAGELPESIPHDADDMYSFTYIDGGAFNNQPVREAFRLAGFLDALSPWGDYDRRVIHVTPNPSTLPPVLGVSALREYTVQRVKKHAQPTKAGEVNKHVLAVRSTFVRLFDQAFALIDAVLDQARAREMDRVASVCDVFARRSMLRRLTFVQPVGDLTDALIQELWRWCEGELNQTRVANLIPPGTLTVEEELARVASEIKDGENALLTGAAGVDAAAIRRFSHDRVRDANAPLMFKLLQLVALDIALDLTGKDELARLVSIAPITLRTPPAQPPAPPIGDAEPCEQPAEPIALQESYLPYELPGGPIFGLMGFMIRDHRAHEREVARHAALRFLQWGGLLPLLPPSVAPPQRPRVFTTDERKRLKAMHKHFVGRIRSALSDAQLVNIPCIDKALIQGVVAKLVGNFDDVSKPESLSQDVVVRAVMRGGMPDTFRIRTRRPRRAGAPSHSEGFSPIDVPLRAGESRRELVALWTRTTMGGSGVWRWRFTPLKDRVDGGSDPIVITDAQDRSVELTPPTGAPGEPPELGEILRRLNASARPEIVLELEMSDGELKISAFSVPFNIDNDVEAQIKS